ncbi:MULTISPECIES: shikimate kinase [Burkholderia]|uniref:Shikimate kinase n=1 Tax=Burkholderia contaminans TaxID=488447 RepID=A0A1E3FJY4_9BURK|nr:MULTISPECIES: shikimate kinase [Burkholderia]UTP23765.1 shikimate kinase [Burkholderia sp. FXe9]MCA7907743.1 shikimate kinase [Burkholderia contaminans]MCA8187699.1 shikimate kinase [Burkholderia contaminans]MCA8370624.1 shikimate kinase [Burkholderia contaminans]MCQ4559234.1 shikimate kinase [Burkholderia contaminans]
MSAVVAAADARALPARAILVGMMGAGKSTLGRALAASLGWTFVDSDDEIERRTGRSVAALFDQVGEGGFRLLETQIVDELTQRPNAVVATGGGAVLNPRNRARMSERGCVIYLHADPDALWRRTRDDPRRPLLRVADPRQTLAALYRLRDPLYRECAHALVDTTSQDVARATADVLTVLLARINAPD